jgi:hypothetical protein
MSDLTSQRDTPSPSLFAGLVVAGLAIGWLCLQSPPTQEDALHIGSVSDRQLRQLDDSHPVVGFTVLSGFVSPDTLGIAYTPGTRAEIPQTIRDLDGHAIAIDGFMLPIDITSQGVSRFLLNASYDMCQFGAPSNVNQRIDVVMAGGQRVEYTHLPMRVFGVLHVAEELDGSSLVGLYHLDGDAIGPPGLGF